MRPSTKNIIVILDNIRSIHNVGAVFRSADGAGVSRILCCGYTPTPDDPRIGKVALGAEQAVPWEHHDSAPEICRTLQSQGYLICALETGEQAEDLFLANIPEQNIALIFGHEVDGISDEVLGIADKIFVLPMKGTKESLNVSVASGIAMYEAMRK